MSIEASTSWVIAIVLCSTRIAALLVLTPIFTGHSIPPRIRLLLVAGLSIGIVSGLPHSHSVLISDLGHLVRAIATEAGTGAFMGFGVFTAFSAFSFAGKILDIQIGFGLANVFDPATRSRLPLLGSILTSLAVIIFFVSEAHHSLIKGIALSIEKVPLGAALINSSPNLVVAQFGTIFSLGLAIAAPVIFCLFLLDLGLAVISRNLPQLNLITLGVPIKAIVGIGMLGLVVPRLTGVIDRTYASIFVFWDALL